MIRIYHLDARARARLAAGGALPPLWWAESVPVAYRRAASQLLGAPWRDGATRGPDGSPAPWVASLGPTYDERVRPFTAALAVNLAELGRCEAARACADGMLRMRPDDEQARRIRDYCDRRAGERP